MNRHSKIFSISFVLIFSLLLSWTYASPLFSAPDEESHVIWAVAIDRGHYGVPVVLHKASYRIVTVPESVASSLTANACLNNQPTHVGNCMGALDQSQKPTSVITHSAEYPPLYFAFVGLATMFSATTGHLYGMRVLGDLINAILIAIAITALAASSRRRFVWWGFLLALTPQVFYLSSVVNAAGLEITSSLCFWTLLALFVLDFDQRPSTPLIAGLAFSGTMFVLTRPLSPAFLAVAIGTALLQLPLRRLWRYFLSTRSFQVAVGVVSAMTLVALGWIATHSSYKVLPSTSLVLIKPHESTLSILRLTFSFIPSWMHQTIGNFGWLDTPLPRVFCDAWYIAVFAVVLFALIVGTLRQRIALLFITTVGLLSPVLIVASQARHLGIVWQGRDSMPMTVGIPITAAAILASRVEFSRVYVRVSWLLIAFVAGMQIYAFNEILQRFTVGGTGIHVRYLLHPRWMPVLHPVVLALITATSIVVGAVLVLRRLQDSADDHAERALPNTSPKKPRRKAPAHAAKR